MEICPSCGNRTLTYSPVRKRAECLNMDCNHGVNITQDEYSRFFEMEDKNVANKLSFPRRIK